MALRVAMSTSECPCWRSRHDLPSCPNLQSLGVLECSQPVPCCFSFPLVLTQLPVLGARSPFLLSPTPRGTDFLGPCLHSSQPPTIASLPPGLQSLTGSEATSCSQALTVSPSFWGGSVVAGRQSLALSEDITSLQSSLIWLWRSFHGDRVWCITCQKYIRNTMLVLKK